MISPGTYPYLELRGKSSEAKPTEGIPNGSTFFEMDTSDVYMFDAETKTWLKI